MLIFFFRLSLTGHQFDALSFFLPLLAGRGEDRGCREHGALPETRVEDERPFFGFVFGSQCRPLLLPPNNKTERKKNEEKTNTAAERAAVVPPLLAVAAPPPPRPLLLPPPSPAASTASSSSCLQLTKLVDANGGGDLVLLFF